MATSGTSGRLGRTVARCRRRSLSRTTTQPAGVWGSCQEDKCRISEGTVKLQAHTAGGSGPSRAGQSQSDTPHGGVGGGSWDYLETRKREEKRTESHKWKKLPFLTEDQIAVCHGFNSAAPEHPMSLRAAARAKATIKTCKSLGKEWSMVGL